MRGFSSLQEPEFCNLKESPYLFALCMYERVSLALSVPAYQLEVHCMSHDTNTTLNHNLRHSREQESATYHCGCFHSLQLAKLENCNTSSDLAP